MTRISIGLDDARLRQWSRTRPEAVQRAHRRFLFEAGQLGVKEMKGVARERFNRIGVRHPGVGKLTNRLRSTIHARRTRTYVDIQSRVYYDVYVDDGTRPHVILPKRGKALKFQVFASSGRQGRVKSNTVFSRGVKHPGFKGHAFIRRTANRVRPKLDRIAVRAIEREVAR